MENWKKVSKNHVMVLDTENELIASCLTGRTQAENEANASLIAAAPDLLAALNRLVFLFTESHQDEIESGHFGDDAAGYKCSYCSGIAQAKAAIAKAEGGAQ